MKILVIEDDQTTRDFIAKALEQEGFIVDSSGDGKEGLMMAISCEYQLIVLDRMLPNLDGLKILSAIRATDNNTPVLILSALDSVDQRVEGLTAGSDDYLTKPFALAELLARINIILRRNRPIENTLNEIQINNLTINLRSQKVTINNVPIALQNKEFILLRFLVEHVDEVVSRMRLFEAAWDYHFDPKTNVIDVHIAKLRKKLEHGGAVNLIETVRGAGYVIRQA
ncbi:MULTISPECIES: response regulator transcription factor [Aliivibrio]|jgi:two-component system OmpR family response regulator|uniref:Response regulator transcription factor n=2 Tax=Aliivibrio TaxID=511678 RepID=A0A4Q5KWP9_9GAMM|nr:MULTISPECIES: response regulator transcription factor [Aliivibrio]CED57401.1 transcriptional regulator, response regulator [Aliivibrio wodanis]KAB2824632.1 response regulator transcription factor [Aliivibrio finisterrensis]MDD9178532.1 response regulator transcription factor [Aliivibrio sp. A6]RYU53027.1 response regulator transcription factor [Aliivibrio finisterrensis]RYU53423.1 response regulator transcription factor [Aliivibrio finisterrensis]